MPGTMPQQLPGPQNPAIASNIHDVALVLEGGGMRGAYTAAVVNTLLDEGLYFDHVSGISAGSSNAANYLSRDQHRTRYVFTDFAEDPRSIGWNWMVRGHGYFNVDYLYAPQAATTGPAPFHWDTFSRNPATLRIGVFNATRGKEEWLGKEDAATVADMMRVVRSSSTLPLLMPSVQFRGDTYYDGGLGPDGGIPLDAPMRDGYRTFFVVLTRPRGYVKPPVSRAKAAMFRTLMREYPAVAEGYIQRPRRYNAARAVLRTLEAQGRAYVFYPQNLAINNIESNPDRLRAAYQAGLRQAQAEVPRWHEFLGL